MLILPPTTTTTFSRGNERPVAASEKEKEKGNEEASLAQDQTRSSLRICVSFIKQVNPAWHLLSESPEQNNQPKKKKKSREEKSVKPVALTYLTAVV